MNDKLPCRRGFRPVFVLYSLCLAACAWLAAVAIAAAGERNDCLSGRWIDETTAFVTEVTGAAVPSVCIRQPRSQNLNQVAGLNASGNPDVAALFLPERGEILLGPDLELDGHVARGYLAHELVHAQQFAAGRHLSVSCRGRLEYEAYSVQARYLRRHGLKQDAFQVRLMAEMLQASCREGY